MLYKSSKNISMSNDYREKLLSTSHWLERDSQIESYVYLIKEFSKDITRKRLLDIGCSTGGDVEAFRQFGFDASGADFDKKSIKEAKLKYPKCKFFYADAEDLCFPDNRFDISFSTNTLFFTNIEVSVLEAIRVTKEGGIVVLSFDVEIFDEEKKTVIHQFDLGDLDSLIFPNRILYAKYCERVDNNPFQHKHRFYKIIIEKLET